MTLCYVMYTFPFTFLLLWHAFCHVQINEYNDDDDDHATRNAQYR